MKTVKNKIILMIMIAALPMLSFAKGIDFQHLSLQEALDKAEKENKAIFIDIYATWCGPCKYLSKNIFTDNDLGSFMNDNFICIKLDGEQEDGESLMYDFDLSSYPTMLFLDHNKKLLRKVVGAVPAEEIKEEAIKVLDPTSTHIYKLDQKYKAGNRDREFLAKYIDELTNEESENSEKVVEEFIELFPNLDLNNELELLIFCIGINDLNHELVRKFMKDVNKLEDVNLGYVQWKAGNLLLLLAEEAIEKDDKSHISKNIDPFFKTYEKALGEEAMSKSEVIDVLEETFDESQF